MAYHVEISASALRHARAFNLDAEQLRREVLEPWLAEQAIELGDREWAPAESSLRVLEGPRLEGPDLSFGQGWSNAERSADDVTEKVLAEARREAPALPEAAAIDAAGLEEALARLGDGARPRAVELSAAREALERRDPRVAAVLLVTRPGAKPLDQRQS